MTSATRTLKSASGIACDGGQAKSILNDVNLVTGVSPAPSPVRLFFQHLIPGAAGISFSGGAAPTTAAPSVPTARYPNSTEQTATSGPASGGSNVFQA